MNARRRFDPLFDRAAEAVRLPVKESAVSLSGGEVFNNDPYLFPLCNKIPNTKSLYCRSLTARLTGIGSETFLYNS